MVISVLVSAFSLPIVGRVTDSISPRYTVPGSFIFRFLTTVLFFFVKTPDEWLAYVSSILMIVATIVENIAVDTIFS